ncbi:MAG: hypothetical protein IJ064_06535 [Bacteroidaceae bacterium]|nr:hypothetical protein [Bacteroidaceae bacterium]
MSKYKINRNLTLLVVTVLSLGLTQSCKEDIDMSNQYTFTEYTISSYLQEHKDTYSEYLNLLEEVHVSSRSESSVLQLLTARGKYTVFAPTNQAIMNYLDTLYTKGIISAPSWDGFDAHTLDSIQKIIVYNSIIDGTKDDIEPYQTSAFNDNEELGIASMNDRKLRPVYGNNPDSIFINATIKIPDSIVVDGVKKKNDNEERQIIGGYVVDLKNRDIYTANGYIHQMRDVIAPSNETLADLLQSYIDENVGDYIVMAKMVQATGLTDTLSKVKDEVYENLKQTEDPRLDKLPNFNEDDNAKGGNGFLPEHRYYGYTMFAEPDDFWRTELGKEPKDISPADIQAWVVSKGFYPEAKNNTSYKDEDNALNMFLTYHLLPMRLPSNKLVIHYNERGYNYKTSTAPTVPTYEIYTTMGKRRLIKLYQAGARFSADGESKIYINRFPELNNGRHEDYSEKSGWETPETEGIVVGTESATNLLNAIIYPINKVLVYDEATRENLQKQRIRFDLTSMCPEFMNNDLRANREVLLYTGMPADENYKYLDNIELRKGTNFYYLSGLGKNWLNWQGDEFNIRGKYEVIFTLPPVPKAGTYEIRFAVQSNSNKRSMCQVYFGKNKSNLPAMGLPLDLRQAGTYRALASGNVTSALVGWEKDTDDDDDYNAEVDKKMRNNDFMKGPAIYAGTPGGSNYARSNEQNLRRIIVREYMQPDVVYYLKFKSVLDDDMKEFYMDYFEYCAKEVYDNPMTPEDIW